MASGGLFGGQLQCFQSFQLLPNPIHFHAAAQQSQPIPIYHLALSVMPNQATSDAKKKTMSPTPAAQARSCSTSWALRPTPSSNLGCHGSWNPWLWESWWCCSAVCKGCCPMLYLYHSASGMSQNGQCFFVSIGGTTRKTMVLLVPGGCSISSAIYASMEMFIINYSTSLLTWSPFSGPMTWNWADPTNEGPPPVDVPRAIGVGPFPSLACRSKKDGRGLLISRPSGSEGPALKQMKPIYEVLFCSPEK